MPPSPSRNSTDGTALARSPRLTISASPAEDRRFSSSSTARLGEQGIAGAFAAVGEMGAGRAFDDQSPMPQTLPMGDLTNGGVEGVDGDAEIAERPRPVGLE